MRRRVFDAVGAKTLWLGEAGAGSRLKLVLNTWLLALVEGLAEAIALAEALGVDPQTFLDDRSTAARWARPTRSSRAS